MTLIRIAGITGATLDRAPDPHALVTGPVVIDSREAGPGALFAALPGERADGHDFAAAAVSAGAVAVLTSRPAGVPALVVPDVQAALAPLARAVVDRLPQLTIAAITGSSGKTTTKDLLAQVAERLRPDGGAGRLVQQRARAPAHGAARRRADPVPGAGARRPRPRPHRAAVRDRAAPAGRRAERGPGPRRRLLRRPGRGGAGQRRAGRGAAPRRRGRAQRRRPGRYGRWHPERQPG